MKKLFVSLLIAFSPVLIFAQDKEINDPNAEVRNVSSFHAIKVSDAIDLYISQSDAEAVAVSAATTEYRDKIVTEVQDGVLKISTTDHGKWWKSVRNKKMKAYVSFKTLTRLEAHGASDVFLNSDLKADELSVVLSGASDLKGQKGKIEVRALDLTLSGASDAVIHGTVITLTVEASGASDLKGYDLQTDHCNANASGASDIKITVNKDLSAKASGASGVHYKGEGVIRDLRTSGASNISRKG